MSDFVDVLIRIREMIGENRRGSVRNAIPVNSTVVVNTLRLPFTSELPKYGSKKYFCAISHENTSRACGGPGIQRASSPPVALSTPGVPGTLLLPTIGANSCTTSGFWHSVDLL